MGLKKAIQERDLSEVINIVNLAVGIYPAKNQVCLMLMV